MSAPTKKRSWFGAAVLLATAAAILALTSRWWLPTNAAGEAAQPGANDPHSGHDHAAHDDGNSLELSDKALRNIGYEPLTIRRQPFTKTTTVPAMVVERPGRSQLDVTAPMTGIVTKVYAVQGEAVAPGEPLFDMRLTHEDLVESQRNFLRSVEELDVVETELKRLESIGDAIPGKVVLAQKYRKQQLDAAIHAQREGLLLHGLSEQQVSDITQNRSLLESLTIVAPQGTGDCVIEDSEHLFNVQKLNVKPGQQVPAGTTLCVLGDHCRLYIEGKAFEEDAELLNQVMLEHRKVSAVRISRGTDRDTVNDLEILYLSDSVESDTRALHFYIGLPNKLIRDQKKNDRRYIGWKYKPGQRFEVSIPVKHAADRIVLPVDAVVEEGAEAFVFQKNGKRFDRVEVTISDRDQRQVEIRDDGSLYPGDIIAGSGAYEMHLDMKNKAGGGIDPHAGHSH